jgi:hypothetical protein
MNRLSMLRRYRRTVLCIAICMLVCPITACRLINRNANPVTLSVRPAQDTAWLKVGPTAASFEIRIVVRNSSATPVYTQWCGTEAERLIQGTWQTVFKPNCLANDSPLPIAPGGSVTLPLLAYGTLEPAAWPKLDPRMRPGIYRAVVYLFTLDRGGHRTSIPESDERSSTFVVALQPK